MLRNSTRAARFQDFEISVGICVGSLSTTQYTSAVVTRMHRRNTFRACHCPFQRPPPSACGLSAACRCPPQPTVHSAPAGGQRRAVELVVAGWTWTGSISGTYQRVEPPKFGVAIGVGFADTVDVLVGVGMAEEVAVAAGVLVGVRVADEAFVAVGVLVRVGEEVAVAVRVLVGVGLEVGVGVASGGTLAMKTTSTQ